MDTTDEQMETTSGPHWVLLETGSNQKYIFSTTKQRFQVAASAAIWTLGYEWVRQACEEVSEAYQAKTSLELPYLGESADICGRYSDTEDRSIDHHCIAHIVKASGKAYLLVPNEEIGKEIIRKVTYRAVNEHSGIDVWGIVSKPLAADLSDAGDRLAEANAALEQQRYKRLSPEAASGMSPFHARCEYSGGPAAYLRREPDSGVKLISPTVGFLETNVSEARERMENKLLEGLDNEFTDAVVKVKDLDRGLTAKSWIGVIHADGNGVGKIFMNLRQVFLETSEDGDEETARFNGAGFVVAQTQLSRGLEELTWQSFRNTLKELASSPEGLPKNSVLPIVVGGDDVILVVNGEIAYRFAETLTRQFQETCEYSEFASTKSLDDKAKAAVGHAKAFADIFVKIRELDTENTSKKKRKKKKKKKFNFALEARKNPQDAQQLSMAAGLLITKKKHPFHHSVEVAEELTSFAKETTRAESSIAVHVLYEPSLRTLSQLRADATVPATESYEEYCYLAAPFFTVGKATPEKNSGSSKHVESAKEMRDMLEIFTSAFAGSSSPDKAAQSTEDTGKTGKISRGILQEIRSAITESDNVEHAQNRLEAVRKRAEELGYDDVNKAPLGDISLSPAAGTTMFMTAMELKTVMQMETNSKPEEAK